MRRHIFFVTYGGGHVDIVLRLLPHLENISNIKVTVLALTTAGRRIEQTGRSVRGCRHYLPRIGYEDAIALGEALSEGLWDKTGSVPWEESCAYLGVSFADLRAEVGSDEASRRYQRYGRGAFCPTNFLKSLLRDEKPDIVVTTCHVRMERAAVLAAKDLGIISVRIEDLFGYSLLGTYGNGVAPQLISESEWPDEVIVLNDEVRRRVIAAGFPPAKVYSFGQPVFSDLKNEFSRTMSSSALAALRKRFGCVVTYIAPPLRDVLKAQTDSLLKVASRNPNIGFCIKLHPSVPHGEFTAKYSVLPSNVCLLGNEDAIAVVKASDIVLTFNSTVGLFCIFQGIPLLVVDTSNVPDFMPYVSSGAARGIKRLDQLEAAILEMLDDAPPSKPAVEFGARLFENPPGASLRISQWLATLVHNKT